MERCVKLPLCCIFCRQPHQGIHRRSVCRRMQEMSCTSLGFGLDKRRCVLRRRMGRAVG